MPLCEDNIIICADLQFLIIDGENAIGEENAHTASQEERLAIANDFPHLIVRSLELSILNAEMKAAPNN